MSLLPDHSADRRPSNDRNWRPRAPQTGPSTSSPWQKAPLHSTGDASRLTALFLGRIWPICSLVTPCQPGASPVSVRRGVSPRAASRPRRSSRRRSRHRLRATDSAGPRARTVGREVDDRTRRPVLDLAPHPASAHTRPHVAMSLLPDEPRSVHRLACTVVVPIRFVRQCLDHADVMRKRRRDDHPNRRTELRCRLPRTHRGLVGLVGLLNQSHNGELLCWTGDAARTALLDKAARHRQYGADLGSARSSRVTAPPSRPPVSTTPAAHPGSPADQLHHSRYPPARLIALQPQGSGPGTCLWIHTISGCQARIPVFCLAARIPVSSVSSWECWNLERALVGALVLR